MLDDLFASARTDARAEPSEALMARILGDADAAMERDVAPVRARAVPGWRVWLRALGGWPSVGGLAMATLAGIWVGLSADTLLPASLGDLVQGQTNMYLDDFTALSGFETIEG